MLTILKYYILVDCWKILLEELGLETLYLPFSLKITNDLKCIYDAEQINESIKAANESMKAFINNQRQEICNHQTSG